MDHAATNVATGANFDVQVVVTPPEPYHGYQYRLLWPEMPSCTSLSALSPEVLGLCADVTTNPSNINDGIYGGCLRSKGIRSSLARLRSSR